MFFGRCEIWGLWHHSRSTSIGSCWGVVLGQIFFEELSPLSLLLLRFTFVSMGASPGSAAGAAFFFFLEVFVAGTGEDTAGLMGLLGFTVVSGTGSGSREFSWLGFFSFAWEAEVVTFGWLPFFPFF